MNNAKLAKRAWQGFRIALLAAIIAVALALGNLAQENDFIRDTVARFGYGGIFLAALVSGFNLLVPVPIVSFFPLFEASGLDLRYVALIAAAGVTIADSASFYIGRMGHELWMRNAEERVAHRLEALRGHYYWAPIIALFFFAAFVPFPNELLIVPLGFLGYRLGPILVSALLGNAVFTALFGFGLAGLFG